MLSEDALRDQLKMLLALLPSQSEVDRAVRVHRAALPRRVRRRRCRLDGLDRDATLLGSVVRSRYDAFPPFDDRLLHCYRPMNTVEFVIET